jgi:hypothetical protein
MLITKLLAQQNYPLGNIGGPGFGTINNSDFGNGLSATPLEKMANIISGVIGFMTIGAGIWFIFMFLVGGYTWMTSMGDKHRLEEARDRIVNALIGLVIVVGGWAMLALVGQFFGIDTMLNDTTKIITNLHLR